ncbi:zinc finger and BTB domain-containing protein 16-like [Lethenteron reissneri]|uniref:zinc finger and BTB domain-containing protein 16-like n=1 Tax=Lethenteron reissneri TaxID=7753 RepID=UPI002AB736D6|nr:zinc finger and BTB domain-containing protein 16-like [Lethenteron reissneri]
MWIENPEHQVRFLAEANRMRRTGALCDVVIAVGSRRFYAHKLVLACVSKTLEALFKQPSLRYTLDFLTPLTFEQIMEYAYSGSVEVQADQVPRLLHASQLLQIDCLVELCLGLHHAAVQGLSPEARLVIERGPSTVGPADEEDEEDDQGCNNPNNNGTTTIVATAGGVGRGQQRRGGRRHGGGRRKLPAAQQRHRRRRR